MGEVVGQAVAQGIYLLRAALGQRAQQGGEFATVEAVHQAFGQQAQVQLITADGQGASGVGLAEAQVVAAQVGFFKHQNCPILRPTRQFAGDMGAPVGVLVHRLVGAQLFGDLGGLLVQAHALEGVLQQGGGQVVGLHGAQCVVVEAAGGKDLLLLRRAERPQFAQASGIAPGAGAGVAADRRRIGFGAGGMLDAIVAAGPIRLEHVVRALHRQNLLPGMGMYAQLVGCGVGRQLQGVLIRLRVRVPQPCLAVDLDGLELIDEGRFKQLAANTERRQLHHVADDAHQVPGGLLGVAPGQVGHAFDHFIQQLVGGIGQHHFPQQGHEWGRNQQHDIQRALEDMAERVPPGPARTAVGLRRGHRLLAAIVEDLVQSGLVQLRPQFAVDAAGAVGRTLLQAVDKCALLLAVDKLAEELAVGRVLQFFRQRLAKGQGAGVGLYCAVGVMGDVRHHRRDIPRQVEVVGNQQHAGEQGAHQAQSIELRHCALTLHGALQQVKGRRVDLAAQSGQMRCRVQGGLLAGDHLGLQAVPVGLQCRLHMCLQVLGVVGAEVQLAAQRDELLDAHARVVRFDVELTAGVRLADVARAVGEAFVAGKVLQGRVEQRQRAAGAALKNGAAAADQKHMGGAHVQGQPVLVLQCSDQQGLGKGVHILQVFQALIDAVLRGPGLGIGGLERGVQGGGSVAQFGQPLQGRPAQRLCPVPGGGVQPVGQGVFDQCVMRAFIRCGRHGDGP